MSLNSILDTFAQEKQVAIEREPEPKFIEKDKEGISLKGVLQRGRLKLTRARTPRPQGVTFRPSMITYSYCRRLKIGQLAGVAAIYDRPAKPRQQMIFDMGNAMHEIIQTYFWQIGILKGTYKCTKCDKLYHDLISPSACPSGKTTHTKKFLEYREVKLWDEEHLISGRADGILVIDDEEHIMDIKSIANRVLKSSERQFCFEDLKERGPKEAHVIQLNLYMYITGIRRGHLLYIAKNDGQILTFSIPYNYETIRPYLEEIKHLIGSAELLKKGELKSLPECCSDEECPCHEVLLSSKP